MPSPSSAGGSAATTSPSPPVLTQGYSSAATCRARSVRGRARAWAKSRSVLRAVDQRVLLDPRHHRAQALADLFDIVLGGGATHGLKARLPGIVLEHPVAREAAGLDVGEDALHFGLDAIADHPRAARVIAVFGGVRDRVAHIGDAAFIDQVDDQLHLVQAFEIRHLGRVAGLDQGLVAGDDEAGQPAAQHRLLAEQVGLAFLFEARLDDPRAAAADRAGIAERDLQRVAGFVLIDRHQTRHTAATQIFRAYGVAGAFGRNHEHVHVWARLDQAKMDAEPVR